MDFENTTQIGGKCICISFLIASLSGERWDKRDLIEEWKKEHPKGEFVYTRDQLLNVDTANLQDQLLGRNRSKNLT